MATYDELAADLPRHVNRDFTQDVEFAAAIPRFFENAQRRIAHEIDFSGLHDETTGDFVDGSTLIPRPQDAFTINYVEARFSGQNWSPLRARAINFLKSWREFQSVRARPRYWALFDHNNLYVAPVPTSGLEYRIGYRRIDDYLGPATQSSYLARAHPDLLLDAVIIEAVKFGKEDREENQAELKKWEASYQQRKAAAIANEIMSGLGATEVGTQVQQS